MKLIPYIIVGLVFTTHLSAAETTAEIKVPFKYGLGKSLFEENCGSCHGVWGKGTDSGPALMHKFYVPSHHGDQAFYQAGLKGVRSHHWNFGDMPPVPGISSRALDKIVPYIRWLQKETKVY
jgi:mono/diheme cytochrome c family protein